MSENVTIYYEGISQKKDWIANGSFANNASGWNYTDTTSEMGGSWISDHSGSVRIRINETNFNKGNYSYYERNFTIAEPFSDNEVSTLSFDYRYDIGGWWLFSWTGSRKCKRV